MSVIHSSDAPAWPLDRELDLDHRAERDLPERGAWVDRLLVQRGFFAAPFDRFRTTCIASSRAVTPLGGATRSPPSRTAGCR